MMLKRAVLLRRRAVPLLFPLLAALVQIPDLRAADPRQDSKPFDLGGPQVSLPAAVQGTKQQGPDFDTYCFTIGVGKGGGKGSPKRRQILFAYVGFAPSFPGATAPGVSIRHVRINGRPARSVEGQNKQGRRFREVLWQTGRRDYARYVHFLYSDLTVTEAQRAEAIIASVRSSG